MKRILFMALAAGMITAFTTVSAQKPGDAAAQNYVEVTGTATTRVTPNKVEVAIRLNEADSKGKTSLASMEKSLASALNQAGVDIDKQLVVTEQSSASEKKKSIYQYKSYLLTLTSAAEVSTVFELLEANGIGNAEVVNTDHTDIKSIEQTTKAEAIKNAQATAKTLAETLGQSIGKAIYIQDYSTSVAPVFRNQYSKAAAGVMMDAAPLSNVQFQDMRIDQRVTVRFILE